MVTLNYANIIVFKYLNAGVRISLPVNYIASAYNAINPRSVQVADSCFEPFVFGVNVTDNPNSPVSHAKNLFSGLGCIIVIPYEINDDECDGHLHVWACLRPDYESFSESRQKAI